VDAEGNLFVADSYKIRQISVDGMEGVAEITRVRTKVELLTSFFSFFLPFSLPFLLLQAT
jgi:hypothetical protein